MSQRRRSIRKANKKQSAPLKNKTSPRQKLIIAGVVILALLFGVSMFLSTPNSSNRNTTSSTNTTIPASNAKTAEPQFIKEGTLQFLKDANIKAAIEIEVANTADEIEQGLMHRRKMDQNKGMLFIFPDMQPRGFWMKNTHIPLDIIYVDADKTIVSIQKNTIPLSRQDLPSDGEAQYVIEVNAGFSDLYNIVPGDNVDFQIN